MHIKAFWTEKWEGIREIPFSGCTFSQNVLSGHDITEYELFPLWELLITIESVSLNVLRRDYWLSLGFFGIFFQNWIFFQASKSLTTSQRCAGWEVLEQYDYCKCSTWKKGHGSYERVSSRPLCKYNLNEGADHTHKVPQMNFQIECNHWQVVFPAVKNPIAISAEQQKQPNRMFLYQ